MFEKNIMVFSWRLRYNKLIPVRPSDGISWRDAGYILQLESIGKERGMEMLHIVATCLRQKAIADGEDRALSVRYVSVFTRNPRGGGPKADPCGCGGVTVVLTGTRLCDAGLRTRRTR